MILIEPQLGESIIERIPKWCRCTVKKGTIHASRVQGMKTPGPWSLLWKFWNHFPRTPLLRNSHSKQDRFVLLFFLLKYPSLADS